MNRRESRYRDGAGTIDGQLFVESLGDPDSKTSQGSVAPVDSGVFQVPLPAALREA